MAVAVWFRIMEERPPDLVIRAWREIRKSAMRRIGLRWHQEFLPKHFEPNAANVYRYDRRTSKWIADKRKAAERGTIGTGKNLRLVDPRAATDQLTLTGALRDNATRQATVKVFPTRFTVTMPGTSYTPSRPRGSGPWLAAEVTKLLKYEKDELARDAKQLSVELLNQYRETRTTEIRG
jgi:hypothetical protein